MPDLDEITGSDDWVHLFCPCTPHVLLCGAEDDGGPPLTGDEDDDEICPFCLALEDTPCPYCGSTASDWEPND